MRNFAIAAAILLASIVSADRCFADDADIDSAQNVLTLADRMQYMGLIIPDDVRLRFAELDRQPSPVLLNPAEYFDWREMSGVSSVKDQGACGSCWDFAAVGAFESAMMIAHRYEWDLSEQQVIDCNAEQYGCGGGWMSSVYDLFMNYGAIEEDCYPYYARDDMPCRQDTCVVMALMDDYIDIQNDVNAIKNALLNGPVSTTLSIPEGFSWDCFDGQWGNADHAVVIVGWDDNLCGGGWIVKNSWGLGWGDEGFFYMPYGSCGIGHYTQIPIYERGLPKLVSNREMIEMNVPSGGQGSDILRLADTGQEDLYFRIRSYCLQDSFGYYWLDSDSPAGPEYSWVDISEVGEPINFPGYPGYSNSGPLDFGFDFDFYGNTFNSICVCPNGWASFTDSLSRTSTNKPIPDPDDPNNLLAAFWENLNPAEGGEIYFYSNYSDTAVISWVEVPDVYRRGEFTFQIILSGDHTIVYQYASMGPEGPLDEATVGIENAAGTVGLEVCYNEFLTFGEKAIKFDPGQPAGEFDWLELSHDGGVIGPGDTVQVTVDCIAGDHLDGSYWACIELYTNDPENKLVTIPVTMNVGMTAIDNPGATPLEFSLEPCYPNPFNRSVLIGYSLPASSHVKLSVYDVLGRDVAALVDADQEAGYHQVVWNSDNCSSGIYFYTLRAGIFSESKRMLLLK